MALKAALKKPEYDALPDAVKKEYVDNGDGEFSLDIDGAEDTGALKRTIINVKRERDDLKTRFTTLETEFAEVKRKTESKDNKDKTPKQIEDEWKAKYDKDVTAQRERGDAALKHLQESLARNIAAELFVAPKIGIKYVQDRIKVTFDDNGELKTVVLHEDGNESDLTIDKFKEELKKDKGLSAVLKGSKGSGGGANTDGSNGNGGAANGKAFKDMDSKERAELLRTDPERFTRESAAVPRQRFSF